MAPAFDVQQTMGGESGAIYRMILDTAAISNEKVNVVQLPEPELLDTLPPEVREILVQPMAYPNNRG